MDPTPAQLAEAFSRHDFEAVLGHLADDVVWWPVGAEEITGRDAVVAVCQESAVYMAEMTTTFRSFRVVDGGSTVVTESLADYADAHGERSTIASCDVYDVTGGVVARITSYTHQVT